MTQTIGRALLSPAPTTLPLHEIRLRLATLIALRDEAENLGSDKDVQEYEDLIIAWNAKEAAAK